MSRSLARVRAALEAAGRGVRIVELPQGTCSAEETARAVGCEIDRMAKSVVLRGAASGQALLFVFACGERVNLDAATALLGEPLVRADAAFVRAHTGFAIGDVAPIAHRHPPRAFWDPRLDAFETVWAAAGTPRHVFEIPPAPLRTLTDAMPAAAALNEM